LEAEIGKNANKIVIRIGDVKVMTFHFTESVYLSRLFERI
jgi:hypothetical protein